MINLDEIERIARLGVPLGLSVEQLRRIVAQRHDGMLEMVAELRDARIGDDDRTRLQFSASLAEHQRNDAMQELAAAEAVTDEYRVANMGMLVELTDLALQRGDALRTLAEVDRTISDVFPGSTEDGINAVLWACIARHRARQEPQG